MSLKQQTPAQPLQASAPAIPPAELQWTFNPWQRNWRRPALGLALILGVALLAGYTFTTPRWWPEMIGWSTVSFLLLFGMTSLIYLPVRYKLDARGVTVYFLGAPSFRAWTHYRNYYPHKDVVHLTTMPRPSPLDPFRGHSLQFGSADTPGARERVLAMLAAHIRRE